MKAIFKCEGKELINEKIENVALAIEFFDHEDLVEEILEEFDCMEDYVHDKLKKETNLYNRFRVGLQAPIDEIVYFYTEDYMTGEGEEGLYPKTQEELQLLIEIHNEVLKAFNKEQVRIMVGSNSLWEDCNEQDFSLEEFLSMFKLVEE